MKRSKLAVHRRRHNPPAGSPFWGKAGGNSKSEPRRSRKSRRKARS